MGTLSLRIREQAKRTSSTKRMPLMSIRISSDEAGLALGERAGKAIHTMAHRCRPRAQGSNSPTHIMSMTHGLMRSLRLLRAVVLVLIVDHHVVSHEVQE